jgi:hypothetical protein
MVLDVIYGYAFVRRVKRLESGINKVGQAHDFSKLRKSLGEVSDAPAPE